MLDEGNTRRLGGQGWNIGWNKCFGCLFAFEHNCVSCRKTVEIAENPEKTP
jgi:hypothetical protein